MKFDGRRSRALSLGVVSLVLVGGGWSRAAERPGSFEPQVVATSAGVRASFRMAGEPPLVTTVHGGRVYERLSPELAARESRIGWPDVPLVVRLVALPPGSDARLVVEKLTYAADVAHVRLAPVPRQSEAGEPVFEEDGEAYATPALDASLVVRLMDRAVLRDLDVIRLEVRPFLYDPVAGRLRPVKDLDVRIDFTPATGDLQVPAAPATPWEGAAGARLRPGGSGLEPLRRAAPAVITAGAPALAQGAPWLNPPDPAWRVRRLANTCPSAKPPVGASAKLAVKIDVDVDGLTKVTAASVSALGVSLAGVSTANLRLYYKGAQVPLHVFDVNQDDLFGASDSFEFVATRNTGRYSDTSVYWLTLDEGPGLRMIETNGWPAVAPALSAVNSYKTTLRLENPQTFFGADPNGDSADSDNWFFKKVLRTFQNCAKLDNTSPGFCNLTPSTPQTLRQCCLLGGSEDYPFTIQNLRGAEAGQSYSLRARVAAYPYGSNIDSVQRLSLSLNGTVLDDNIQWTTSESTAATTAVHLIDMKISPGLLKEGLNTLHLYQPYTGPPGDDFSLIRQMYVDWFEVEAPLGLVATASTKLDFSGSYARGGVYYAGGFNTADVEIVNSRSDGGVRRLSGYRASSLAPGMPWTIVFGVEPPLVGGTDHYLVVARSALGTPKQLRLEATSNLANPANAADYLVISHEKFMTQSQQLADYRQTAAGGSHQTLVANLTDVYDEFSYGLEDAQGVADFISAAFCSWATPPTYVVLVGDTSYDYKNYTKLTGAQYTPQSYLPTLVHRQKIFPLNWYASSDARYATLVGNDSLPDLLIGRIPARDVADVSNVLSKLQTYEAQPMTGAWQRKLLWLGDDDVWNDGSECGKAGQIGDYMDSLITQYIASSPSYVAKDMVKIYAGLFASDAVIRQAILDACNPSPGPGVSLLFFYGHGAMTFGGVRCNELVTDPMIADWMAPSFNNPVALPLILTASCNIGDFAYININNGAPRAMTEAYLIAANRGSIAAISNTSDLLLSDGGTLGQGVIATLFKAENLPPFAANDRILGAVSYGGLMRLYASLGANAEDGILTTTILGDPATQLRIFRY